MPVSILAISTGSNHESRLYEIDRYQQIQNSLACTVDSSLPHITPILRSLHWLNITERIEYKLKQYSSLYQNSLIGFLPTRFFHPTPTLTIKTNQRPLSYTDDTASTVVRLEHCIRDINQWMSGNRMKLNMDKTNLLWAGTRRSLQDLSLSAACIGCYHTKVVHPSAWSCCLNRPQPQEACHQRQCDLLTTESAATFVHAFVTSCVDYCNVVLTRAPKAITNKLQDVMNDAVRIVTSTRKFDRSLKQLMHDNLHLLDELTCLSASRRVTWLGQESLTDAVLIVF